MGVSDRLIVMREGQIVTSFDKESFSEEAILNRALPDNEVDNIPAENSEKRG